MIQKLIDDYIAQSRSKKRKSSGKISPSDLGRCYRYQYWHRKGEEATNPPDIISLRKFEAGKLFHDFVQNRLPEHDTEVLCETEDIKGFADIVGDNWVADIKSVHSFQFWHAEKSNYNIKEKKYQNILQLMCYAMLLGKPKGILVFVSKDDLAISEYEFNLAEWEHHLNIELGMIRRYWAGDVLPPTQPRAYDGKECKYCIYRDKCNGHKQTSPNT